MGIDVARGMAVLLMIQTHAYDGWVRDAERAGLGFRLTRVLGTLPLPMFLMLAGLGLALRAEADTARGIAPAVTRGHSIRSALEIVLVGYALSALYALLDGARSLDTLLRADVLHAIGLSLVSVAALGLGRPQRLARVALVLTVLPVLACPWLTRLGAQVGGPLRYLAGLVIDVPGVTRMPLVPLLSFCAAGVGIGLWLGADPTRERRKLAGLGVAGAVLTALGVASSAWAQQQGIVLSRENLSIALNVIDLDGRALVAIAISALGSFILGRLTPFLVACGRHSLFVYGLHLPFCYGLFARPLKHALSMSLASLLLLGLGALCVAAAVGLERRSEAATKKAILAP